MRTSTPDKRLQLLISKFKYSQRELASIVGVTESAMCHYLKGDREPSAKILVNIANNTGVSPSWILGYGSDKKIEKIKE